MARKEYSDPVIDGAYADLLSEFINYKKALGYSYGPSIQHRLLELSRFLAKKQSLPEIITREYFDEFCSLREGERPANQSLRMTYTRQFCLFLHGKGYACFVPPNYIWRRDDSFIPRIITEEEMARIIAIADHWPYTCGSKRHFFVYPMLLRMLWCCGMRIGEALSLMLGDVDITSGVLTVQKTKNKSTRIIPMSATCSEYARGYWSAMGFDIEDKTSYFYPSPMGGEYAQASVRFRIKQMMVKAGVTNTDGKTPRIHDIRHSYAVRALTKMIDEGMDCYCELPLLSTYMGHVEIRSTEEYLRLTEYGRKTIEEAMVEAYRDLIPGVTNND